MENQNICLVPPRSLARETIRLLLLKQRLTSNLIKNILILFIVKHLKDKLYFNMKTTSKTKQVISLKYIKLQNNKQRNDFSSNYNKVRVIIKGIQRENSFQLFTRIL